MPKWKKLKWKWKFDCNIHYGYMCSVYEDEWVDNVNMRLKHVNRHLPAIQLPCIRMHGLL